MLKNCVALGKPRTNAAGTYQQTHNPLRTLSGKLYSKIGEM